MVGAMNIGGIENMLMTLMPYMLEQGIIFDFAVHGDEVGAHEAKVKELGGSVYHLPKFKGINFFSYLSAWKKLLIHHPELKIVHGHMTSTAVMYLGLAKILGRVTIAHSHSTSTSGGKFIYAIKRFLEYPLRYFSDYLCACSAEAANYRFGDGTSRKEIYFLWRNAIDTEKFKFSIKKRNEYRGNLSIGDNSVVIGHVGRMITAKNHIFLLEIFREYQQVNPESKLLLIGDGPLRNFVEQKAKELGIFKDTIFTGTVEDTANYLSAMDVFVFPSIYEGLPVSLIEAQTNKRVCLCSDVIPQEVKISDNIYFLPLTLSAKEWSNQIERCIVKKGEGGVRNVYDVKNVSEEIKMFYKRIC